MAMDKELKRELIAQGHLFVGDMLVHKDVTIDAIAAAVERGMTTLDNPGFCICCGCEVSGVEPDARRLACEACGFPGVYGAEELLIRFF